MRNLFVIMCLAATAITAACSKSAPPVPEAAYSGNAAADIFEAVRVGDRAKVNEFLASDPAMLFAVDAQQRTLLHIAVLANQPKVVHLLVEKGMDPNVFDGTGATPLGLLEQSGMRAENAREAIIELGGISVN